jgi:hypothetical protein
MSASTSATLLDLAAVLSVIALHWGAYVLAWRLLATTLDFFLDEVDLYYNRKYPPVHVQPDYISGRLEYIDRTMLFSRPTREQRRATRSD